MIAAMSSAIAIDVAILPPETVAGPARRMNELLWQQTGLGFRFDDSHLPHVTLLQQVTEQARMAELLAAVERILSDTPPLDLRVVSPGKGRTSTWYAIEPTEELERLHERLFEGLAPLALDTITPAAFFAEEGEPARADDLLWVASYREQSSGERFTPHVTLGVGQIPPLTEPIPFLAGRIAVCQLGRFCTCRKVLGEWDLGPRA